ncbi:sulfurtransferase [Bordetella pertussis]|nr:sulfurtransferase [Bordetella pertussis]
MTTMQQRYDAVKDAMAQIGRLAAQLDGEALREAIGPVLVALGERDELFPRDEFPIRAGKPGGLYQLWRGESGDLALYASAGKTGKKQPPHDHTTWAVIAGVYGEEHNVFFERTDDGSRAGFGTLRQIDALTVVQGNAARLSGEVFHTIEVVSEEDSLHLHLYGRALDTLSGRINFATEEGGAYTRFMAVPETYAPWIAPRDLYEMLTDGGELAILDVRENGVYTQGHLFHAASMPLSVFELRVDDGLPSPHVRIVVIDDADGLAEQAVRLLHQRGYHNVAVLQGGQPGWNAAGLPVYTGVFVPSKAFGEVAEHVYGTPSISAVELDALRRSEEVLVLDSRTEQEFNLMSVPGAYSCPGAELVARALDHAGPIVVNCAGRTRSIIGAQSLRNAGKTDVRALENGTMGQHLAGLPLERGKSASYLDRPVAAGAAQAAQAWALGMSIATLDAGELHDMLSNPYRTTYLFDARDPSCSSRATLPRAVAAPGGQLVQQTDYYAPVRNARIVVFDTDGVQAPMTAGWLHQMGWEVYLHRPEATALVAPPRVEYDDERGVPVEAVAADAVIIDVGDSRTYRAGHLAGAAWAPRSAPAGLAGAAQARRAAAVHVRGRSGLAAGGGDAAAQGYQAAYLKGGTAALGADRLRGDAPQFLTEAIDVWYRPYDRETGIEEAMHQYLSWETGLLDKVRSDPTVAFRI